MPGTAKRPPEGASSDTCKPLDRYHLREQVYKGRVSRIFEAFDRTTGAHVALKIYKKLVLNPLQRAQLDREIEIHSRLTHDNITQLHVVFEDDRGVYLVQEFVGGGDLYSVLRASGKIDEHRAAGTIIMPLLCALRYIHGMGIIHRDIKAENVLVEPDGNVKLADFGFAIDVVNDKRPSSRLGTWEYMAPEIHLCPFRNDKAAQHTNATYSSGVDVWAIGILTFELLTGRPPFANTNGQIEYDELMEQEVVLPEYLTADAASFIRAALCKDPELRPTARQLLKHRWLRPFQKDLLVGRAPRAAPSLSIVPPRNVAPDPTTEYSAAAHAPQGPPTPVHTHHRPPPKMHSLYDFAHHHPGAVAPGVQASTHDIHTSRDPGPRDPGPRDPGLMVLKDVGPSEAQGAAPPVPSPRARATRSSRDLLPEVQIASRDLRKSQELLLLRDAMPEGPQPQSGPLDGLRASARDARAAAPHSTHRSGELLVLRDFMPEVQRQAAGATPSDAPRDTAYNSQRSGELLTVREAVPEDAQVDVVVRIGSRRDCGAPPRTMADLSDSLVGRAYSTSALAAPSTSYISAPLPLALPLLPALGAKTGVQAARADSFSVTLAAAAAKAKARRSSCMLLCQAPLSASTLQGCSLSSDSYELPGVAAAPAPPPGASPRHGAGPGRFRRASRLSLLNVDTLASGVRDL